MMLSSVDLGLPPWEIVAFLTSGLALSSFAFSGHVIKALFGRASALPKTAPALAPQMERLLWWSWSRFRKYLAKQLHLLINV